VHEIAAIAQVVRKFSRLPQVTLNGLSAFNLGARASDERAHAVPLRNQRARDVTADKAGSAGYKDEITWQLQPVAFPWENSSSC
jgi:hypothetical protein